MPASVLEKHPASSFTSALKMEEAAFPKMLVSTYKAQSKRLKT
jgi:hypothetical protein